MKVYNFKHMYFFYTENTCIFYNLENVLSTFLLEKYIWQINEIYQI